MLWKIITVGKPSLPYARLGIEDYLGRLRKWQPQVKIDWQICKNTAAQEKLFDHRTSPLQIVFDERGENLTTKQWVATLTEWENDRIESIACYIGGADGHSTATRDRADLIISLSPLTLQHELALLVWAEQLYRIYSIIRGEPYHRAS